MQITYELFSLTVGFGEGDLVTTFRVVPAGRWQRPAYADPHPIEREVVVGSTFPLGGTFTAPRRAMGIACVVLVHGSGPNDRDETIGPNKPFKDLALGLASQGIAALRYDKRTQVYRGRSDAVATVDDEVIEDALLAVEVAREQPEVDAAHVFVLGHSLGGMLAPSVAARDPSIAGLVLLAGGTNPNLGEVMREQFEYLVSLVGARTDATPPAFATLREQIARLEAVTDTTPASDLPGGKHPLYWQSLLQHAPLDVVREIRRPTLVLQGERDIQATMRDFERWRDAIGERPDVELKSYPKLNHLFTPGDGPGNQVEYMRPSNVAQEVVTDIAAWIHGRR